MEYLLSILTANGSRSFIAVSVAVRHGQFKKFDIKSGFFFLHYSANTQPYVIIIVRTLKIDIPS